MLAFEPVLLEHNPYWVIVVGDMNSTVACALTAAKLGTKVAQAVDGAKPRGTPWRACARWGPTRPV